MSHEQALEASRHNPAGVNEVLEGLDITCWHCEGEGYLEDDKGRDYGSCPICFGKRKTKHRWSPQVGEWCIGKNYNKKLPLLITRTSTEAVWLQVNCQYWKDELPSNFIPILEWEQCFRILTKVGLWVLMEYGTGQRATCTIKRPGLTAVDCGCSPTEATYKTIIGFGEGLGK